MSGTRVFKTAPYDVFVKITTYGLAPVLVVPSIGWAAIKKQDWDLPLILGGTLLIIYLLSYVFSAVRKYIVNAERVVIKKPVGSFSIPYSQIATVEVVNTVNVGFKACANAGLFGYFGLFFVVDDNDTVRIYATNLKRMAQIKTTDGKKIYLSPAEPEKFVEAVKRHLSQDRQGGEKS